MIIFVASHQAISNQNTPKTGETIVDTLKTKSAEEIYKFIKDNTEAMKIIIDGTGNTNTNSNIVVIPTTIVENFLTHFPLQTKNKEKRKMAKKLLLTLNKRSANFISLVDNFKIRWKCIIEELDKRYTFINDKLLALNELSIFKYADANKAKLIEIKDIQDFQKSTPIQDFRKLLPDLKNQNLINITEITENIDAINLALKQLNKAETKLFKKLGFNPLDTQIQILFGDMAKASEKRMIATQKEIEQKSWLGKIWGVVTSSLSLPAAAAAFFLGKFTLESGLFAAGTPDKLSYEYPLKVSLIVVSGLTCAIGVCTFLNSVYEKMKPAHLQKIIVEIKIENQNQNTLSSLKAFQSSNLKTLKSPLASSIAFCVKISAIKDTIDSIKTKNPNIATSQNKNVQDLNNELTQASQLLSALETELQKIQK